MILIYFSANIIDHLFHLFTRKLAFHVSCAVHTFAQAGPLFSPHSQPTSTLSSPCSWSCPPYYFSSYPISSHLSLLSYYTVISPISYIANFWAPNVCHPYRPTFVFTLFEKLPVIYITDKSFNLFVKKYF